MNKKKAIVTILLNYEGSLSDGYKYYVDGAYIFDINDDKAQQEAVIKQLETIADDILSAIEK